MPRAGRSFASQAAFAGVASDQDRPRTDLCWRPDRHRRFSVGGRASYSQSLGPARKRYLALRTCTMRRVECHLVLCHDAEWLCYRVSARRHWVSLSRAFRPSPACRLPAPVGCMRSSTTAIALCSRSRGDAAGTGPGCIHFPGESATLRWYLRPCKHYGLNLVLPKWNSF